MTTPEGGPKPEIPDEDLTFGETARFRSEQVLIRYGQIDVETDRLVYTWRVGWEWHKKFTLSRPNGYVDPNTEYKLEYEDLVGGGDNGHYDYSQRNGLHETSEIANKDRKEYFASQLSGMEPSEVHRLDLLEYLSTVEKQGTGF